MTYPSPSPRNKRLHWLLAMAVGTSTFGVGQAGAVTPDEVDQAVKRAVDFLKHEQKADGSWENGPKPKQNEEGGPTPWVKYGGETSIATYALLAADEKPTDPQMKKAIEWLEKVDLHGTYAVGLRSQIWQYIPNAARTRVYDMARDHDRDFVVYSRIQRGGHRGFYGYFYGSDRAGSVAGVRSPIDPKGPPEGAWYDRSNSQYGVLGAWALEQAEAEIPSSFWQEEDEAWKKAQLTDGGWDYGGENQNDGATYTMTAAGVATLFITQDYILRMNSHLFDSCHGGVTNANIEKGLAWMDKHINQAFGANAPWHLYGLYGIERIGVASGRKYFGNVDWYSRGADQLVHSQQPNGSFGDIHDTAFALLFLTRGRAPVLMNKLMYETASKKQQDPWNERPRDLANLAHWVGHHSTESFFNWQIVNLHNVDELHDAPILYISGSEELTLSTQDVDHLRLFVEQGGMILGNADCGSRAFTKSFTELGNKMFPKYEFRPLPQNHPIFTSEQYLASKWHKRHVVQGLSNGVRELMLLIPTEDPSRAWQLESTKTREEDFQLANNIFLYSTGREDLEHKGVTYIVNPDGPAGREVKIARLLVGDNPDPEPGAWRRLAAVIHNEKHLDIKPEPVKLAPGSLGGYQVADLTGTTKVILNAGQRQELKDFVSKGGTLIIDAAGGSSDFAESIEQELNTMFGADAAKGLASPLPAGDPMLGDYKKAKHLYRYYCTNLLVGSLREPRVRAITVGGRPAIFYSKEDLTGGLVGEQVDGVLGYQPTAATEIMTALVMTGLKPPTVNPAPVPPPKTAAASAQR